MVVTHVWVTHPHLELNPSIERENFLLGEGTREFEHAIIGVTMCKVDLGRGIGNSSYY